MGVYSGPTGVIMRVIGRRLVEAKESPGRITGSVKTWLYAVQRGKVYSILSDLYPTHHLVPDGIFSFMRDSIILIFILKYNV